MLESDRQLGMTMAPVVRSLIQSVGEHRCLAKVAGEGGAVGFAAARFILRAIVSSIDPITFDDLHAGQVETRACPDQRTDLPADSGS